MIFLEKGRDNCTARFHGVIGYAVSSETRPGVYIDDVQERTYNGDFLSNIRTMQGSGEVSDDINVNNKISIVADPFASGHFHCMRYVKMAGAKWKITNVEVLYPRLILTLGGIYHGSEDDG